MHIGEFTGRSLLIFYSGKVDKWNVYVKFSCCIFQVENTSAKENKIVGNQGVCQR